MPSSSTRLAPERVAQVEVRGHTPGEILRAIRAQKHFTLRQVTDATRRIAIAQDHEEFAISNGRLSEVENKGVVPSIYRLYSLAKVYGIHLGEMLAWFGVPRDWWEGKHSESGRNLRL